MKISYAFALMPPAGRAPSPLQPAHAYAYPEFRLDLPAGWRSAPGAAPDLLSFESDAEGAAVIVSVDSFEIPDAQAAQTADTCITSRIEALEGLSPGRVKVLQRNVRPHASGAALEMSFIAEVEGEQVHLYLGYITARKILNFTMICRPGRPEAVALFNATVPHFRPRLP